MKKALDIVQNLDDVQAVMMLKQIYQDIFTKISLKEINQHIDNQESVSMLKNLDVDDLKQNIDPEQSVELTRKVLLGFASDENLSDLILHNWEKIEKDDSLMIETIVTLGLLANLTLFMATTELEFECKGIKFKKKGANADQIKAVLSPLTELIKKIVPRSL
jgi:predicted nucleic acid-binding protein